jgi:TnpA family transposase
MNQPVEVLPRSASPTKHQQAVLDYYDNRLRIAGSLKFGHVSASLLLSKLQVNAETNALAQAAY